MNPRPNLTNAMNAASVRSANSVLPGFIGDAREFAYEFSAELVTLSENRPAEAEAIRTIRTHVMARHLRDGRRGVATCAATRGVGCTFTAANLAVALSQAGVSTLLIDGDMREPQLETFIRPSIATAGLRQCLTDAGGAPADYIHHDVLPNLSVMYSGGVAEDAQELLASDAYRSLIERSLRDFAFTIVDTPAGRATADALRISTVVGYALVVAKANVTRSADVANLAKQLQQDGAEVIGTVLSEG